MKVKFRYLSQSTEFAQLLINKLFRFDYDPSQLFIIYFHRDGKKEEVMDILNENFLNWVFEVIL